MNRPIPIASVFTFGPDHDVEHRHVVFGSALSDGYVVIEAPTAEIARGIAMGIFGPKWAFQYDMDEFIERGSARHYPLGELLRIAWLDFETLGELHRELREQTKGGS